MEQLRGATPHLRGPPVLRRSLCLRAVPITPASLSDPDGYPLREWQPSPRKRWVGTRDCTFEACSGFTHVTARRLAGPPIGDFCPGGLTSPVARNQPARSYRGEPSNSSGGSFTRKLAPPFHGTRSLTSLDLSCAPGQLLRHQTGAASHHARYLRGVSA